MANQNDNDDFLDVDFDEDLSSSSDKDTLRGDILDVTDVSDDPSDDLSDYDDTEQGIFAPAQSKKKKSGVNGALLGTVATIAIVAAAGFFVYTKTDLLASLKGDAAEQGTVEAPLADAAVPATPDPSAIGDASAPLPDLAADPSFAEIPQPQPIVNAGDAIPAAAPVAMGDPSTSAAEPLATATDAPAVPAPDAAPVETSAATPAPSFEAPPADLPPPPTPEETQAAATPVTPAPDGTVAAPATPAAPADAFVATPPADPLAPVAAAPQPDQPQAVIAPVPQQTALAPAPQPAPAPAPADALASGAGQSGTTRVTESSSARQATDTYYDAPGYSALNNIPTPSLDASRGKGESIIVVQKSRTAAPRNEPKSGVYVQKVSSETPSISASSQEAAIIAAGRALRLARYESALDMYNDLYRANPRDGRILMGRAVALQKLGRSSEAIAAYEEVLAIDDDNPDAIVNMMGLIRKEYPAVALEKLLRIKERNPDNPAVLAQLGVAYADAGNLDAAIASLTAAARHDPGNPQHYFNLGVIAERAKNRARAISYYEKALETDAVYGNGRTINRDMIYDRLTRLRR